MFSDLTKYQSISGKMFLKKVIINVLRDWKKFLKIIIFVISLQEIAVISNIKHIKFHLITLLRLDCFDKHWRNEHFQWQRKSILAFGRTKLLKINFPFTSI